MISAKIYKGIKKMDRKEMNDFLKLFYQIAFEDGLREAEKEFDDPDQYTILSEDEARKKLGEEAFNRLMEV